MTKYIPHFLSLNWLVQLGPRTNSAWLFKLQLRATPRNYEHPKWPLQKLTSEQPILELRVIPLV